MDTNINDYRFMNLHHSRFALKSTKFFTCVLFILCLISFSSCQKEVIEITTSQREQTLVPNSTLTTLIVDAVTLDGSVDNIIDKANCLEVRLPVTVTVNGTNVEIRTKDDYAVIEEIFDRFNNDIDRLDITYPIKVFTNDFQEKEIRNESELQELVGSCGGENEIDSDIECIDFIYPISISVFNTDFDIVDSKTINNDANLFNFLKDLDESTIASIKYPISLVKADGTRIIVNDNDQLENEIEAARDSCDEDDDFNFNDDDPDYCNVDFVTQALERCIWKITEHSTNPLLENFNLRFSNDFTFTVNSNGTIQGFGQWSVEESTNSNVLNLSSNLSDFNGTWTISECGDSFIEISNGIDTIKMQKECPNFETDQVRDILTTNCNWIITDFVDNGNTITDQFTDFKFNFNSDETFELTDGLNNIFPGDWEVTSNQFGNVVLNLSSTFTEIADEYFVASLEADKVLIQSNSGKTIKLQKECDRNNGIDIAILSCKWKILKLEKDMNDLTSNYETYRFKFFDDGSFLFYSDTVNGFDYYIGTWLVVNDANGNQESFLLTSNTLSDDVVGFYNIVSFENDQLILESSNHKLEIEKECI